MKVNYTEYPVEVPLFNLFRKIWIRNSPAWRWQRELIKIHTSEKPYLNTIRESRMKSTANGNVFHCAAYFVYCSQYILINVFFSWCGNKYAFIYLLLLSLKHWSPLLHSNWWTLITFSRQLYLWKGSAYLKFFLFYTDGVRSWCTLHRTHPQPPRRDWFLWSR